MLTPELQVIWTSTSTRAAFVVFLGVAAFSVVRYVNSPWRKLPPGPAGLPILGNVLQMGGKQWLTFSNWRDKYGRLIVSHKCSVV